MATQDARETRKDNAMRVYVAGRTSDTERVRRVQQMVRDRGGEITFDWTDVEGPNAQGEIRRDWSGAPLRARALSERERQAVVDADITILCWGDGACGALLETGIAMGAGRSVIVLGATRESVFWYLPNVYRHDTEQHLGWLLDDLFRNPDAPDSIMAREARRVA